MVTHPRLLVASVAFAAAGAGAAVAAAYEYPWGLALACGLLAAGWIAYLNRPSSASFLQAMMFAVPLAVGLAVVSRRASADGHSGAAPFLVLALAVALHLVVLAAVRRVAAREGEPPATPTR
ncbi:MAG: hypothetical protein JWQ74_969 [Marmoricola sp.]|nr:hypothetical protein [Marmoricola sp.]